MALLVNIVDSSGAVVADGVVVVGQGSSVEHGGASASAATWEQFWICCCQFSPDRRINFHPKHVAWKKRGNTGVQKVLGTKSILRWINTSAASSDELILVLQVAKRWIQIFNSTAIHSGEKCQRKKSGGKRSLASVWISIKLFPSQLVGVHSCAAVFYAVFNVEREAVNCAETIYVGTFTKTVFKGFKAQLIFKKSHRSSVL